MVQMYLHINEGIAYNTNVAKYYKNLAEVFQKYFKKLLTTIKKRPIMAFVSLAEETRSGKNPSERQGLRGLSRFMEAYDKPLPLENRITTKN